MSVYAKAVAALLFTVVLWALVPIAAKTSVQEIPGMTILFIRMLVAALCFLPFFLHLKPWKKNGFRKLVLVSLGSTVNVAFFIWGIRYTSATASQVIYALMPVLIIIFNICIMKMKYDWHKIAGILVSLAGVIYIMYLSAIENGTTISGSLIGNLGIVIAMLGWTIYLMYSKEMNKKFSPTEIGSTSVMVTFLITIPLVLFEQLILKPPTSFSLLSVGGAAYMGVFGTFLAYIFYQYGIAHSSPLTASLTSFIQPVVAAVLAGILIGEKLTIQFTIGSMIVLGGLFFATLYDMYHKRKGT